MLAVALSGVAGQAPAGRVARPEPQPLVTAHVAGVVTAADTHAPLARVRVAATSDRLPAPRVALTDARGHYVIDHLPAGVYRLTFSRSGFVTRPFDAPVDVAERQQVDSVNVVLEPARVISGRVLDEDATPFAGAFVQALRHAVEQGRRTLAVVATATTDDLGRFRLTGLPAGAYLVAATDPAFERAVDERGMLASRPTFYPGVSTPEAALAVTAGAPAGEQPIELQLRLVRPVTVAGRLVSYDRKPLLSAAVVMSPQLENRVVGPSVGQADMQPDGYFRFGNVPPGRYTIRARGETERDGASLFATFAVAVQARDVSQIELTLTPGGALRGRVVAESRHGFAPPPLSSLRVRAPLGDGSGFGDTLTGTPGANGTFRLSGLMAGAHIFTIEGLAFPWRLAEARVQGRDVADRGFDVERGQEYTTVRLLVTDSAAGVSGTVSLPPQVSATEVLVVAFPDDSLRRALPLRFVRSSRPAENGTYRVVDLAPGEYRVVAALEMGELDVMNPLMLERLLAAGTPVTLAEGQVASVALRVVATMSAEPVR